MSGKGILELIESVAPGCAVFDPNTLRRDIELIKQSSELIWGDRVLASIIAPRPTFEVSQLLAQPV